MRNQMGKMGFTRPEPKARACDRYPECAIFVRLGARRSRPVGAFSWVERMPLDRTDVEKIAHLARLAVSDDEKDHYAADLSRILGLVEQMNAVDTADVVPMAHPLHMVQRLRTDEPSEADQRDLFQQLAPATEDGLYLVPKVIE